MQVQVNPQVAARNIAEFIKSHGGNARHTEVLELMARVCGFTTYRALKAAAETPSESKNTGPTAGVKADPDLLEDPQRVVHRQSLVEWDEDDNRVPGRDFEFVLEAFEGCLRMMVKEKGVNLKTVAGTALLDMMVEINQGVPCVHLTNDPNALLMSAFATEAGMYFRPEEEVPIAAEDASGKLRPLVKAASSAEEGYVVKHDTTPDTPAPATACNSCGGATRELPWPANAFLCEVCGVAQDKVDDKTVADLGLPASASVLTVAKEYVSASDNRLGRGIHVEMFTGESTWKDFLYVQVSECTLTGYGDDRQVELNPQVTTGHACYTTIPVSTPLAQVQEAAQDIAQVAAFFGHQGWTPKTIRPVLWLIVEADAPLRMAKKVLDVVRQHSDASACYAELAADFGLVRDPQMVD